MLIEKSIAKYKRIEFNVFIERRCCSTHQASIEMKRYFFSTCQQNILIRHNYVYVYGNW